MPKRNGTCKNVETFQTFHKLEPFQPKAVGNKTTELHATSIASDSTYDSAHFTILIILIRMQLQIFSKD